MFHIFDKLYFLFKITIDLDKDVKNENRYMNQLVIIEKLKKSFHFGAFNLKLKYKQKRVIALEIQKVF
jgi:hypothetical protein